MSAEVSSALIIKRILATVKMSWDILARVFCEQTFSTGVVVEEASCVEHKVVQDKKSSWSIKAQKLKLVRLYHLEIVPSRNRKMLTQKIDVLPFKQKRNKEKKNN